MRCYTQGIRDLSIMHYELKIEENVLDKNCVFLCRENWSGPVPSYQLRFTDGYEPERIYWDENDPSVETLSHSSRQKHQPVCTEFSV